VGAQRRIVGLGAILGWCLDRKGGRLHVPARGNHTSEKRIQSDLAGSHVRSRGAGHFVVGCQKGRADHLPRCNIVTKRGSLVYYLSAWILGCFFCSLAVAFSGTTFMVYSNNPPRAVGLLSVYFFSLVLGAVPMLIFGLLLRKIAALLKCKTTWHWAIFGAILLPVLVVALGMLPNLGAALGRMGEWIATLLTSGPHIVFADRWWLTLPAGAATGYFLGRIQRAFSVQPQTPTTT
jgi:hypothetical protein